MSPSQLSFFESGLKEIKYCSNPQSIKEDLSTFKEFGKQTEHIVTNVKDDADELIQIDTYVNEYWTSKQRDANRLHEVSYRACFKPQLPRFFIQRLTLPGEKVYDPFMGRGTTPIEAALMGRIPLGCDVNPVSSILTKPRLYPPSFQSVSSRLYEINFDQYEESPEELLTFYHPKTLQAICSLKKYFIDREKNGDLDSIDEWIRMVAINRLTGHSSGFFSVYTMPPNQAVSVDSQKKINQKRNQTPPLRDVSKSILTKTRSLLSQCNPSIKKKLSQIANQSLFLTQSSDSTPEIPSSSVNLVVTSPPFLDVVDYAGDNWLRCWFCDIDPKSVPITVPKKLEAWQEAMHRIFLELKRILVQGGYIAFEVGEIRNGTIKLEETVLRSGIKAGLNPVLALINDQHFTKTANCWGVDNRKKGTNTNRVVLFRNG